MADITISLFEANSIVDIIEQIEQLYAFKPGDKVDLYLDLTCKGMTYPEYLAILVGAIDYLRANEIELNIEVTSVCNNSYVARINFYKAIGLDNEEDFIRHNSTGRFVEITNFWSGNNVDITNDIIKVIQQNCCMGKNIINCLNYCLFEVIDNVDLHANSIIDGYTVAQNYPKLNELRIIVLDAGQGIHKALTETNGSNYKSLSKEQALEYCVRKNVTNGIGMGNGLYHTTKFIECNKGEMIIYSGDCYLTIKDGEKRIKKGPYWQGSIIYFNIKTNIDVDPFEVFDGIVPDEINNPQDYFDIDELFI